MVSIFEWANPPPETLAPARGVVSSSIAGGTNDAAHPQDSRPVSLDALSAEDGSAVALAWPRR